MNQVSIAAPGNRFRWSLCQIVTEAGQVVGAGMALDDVTVITCAHVVGDALLGNKWATEEEVRHALDEGSVLKVRRAFAAAARELRVKFAQTALGDQIGEVRHFAPRNAKEGPRDLALLHLPDVVETDEVTSGQLPMLFDKPLHGERTKTLGFPPDVQGTVVGISAADARVSAQGPDDVYLLGKSRTGDDNKLRGGFSGAPVWSLDRGGVLGLIVEADEARGTGGMLPMSIVRGFLAANGYALPAEASSGVQERRQQLQITPQRFHRVVLDACAPRFHLWLTRHGLFNAPAELPVLQEELGKQIATIERDLADKTYIPPPAREAAAEAPTLTFQPVRQAIRMISGLSDGGDSANASVSALSRKSRAVRDLVRLIISSREPIVLLGEPGSGKSISLQQAILRVANLNVGKVYPTISVFVPLGRWDRVVGGTPTAEDVDRLVRHFCPQQVRPYLDALSEQRRLFVVFDGMDEMSRSGYVEHTAALHDYAARRKVQGIRTLFSCRVADFSPNFRHRRLVLMPFGPGQIRSFLRRQFQSSKIVIDGKQVTIRRLVGRFEELESALQISNPYVLFLLSHYIGARQSIPSDRTTLLRHYYEEKLRTKLDDTPDVDRVFSGWGAIAFAITSRNAGGEVIEADLRQEIGRDSAESIAAAVRIGLLERSLDDNPDTPTLLRFENHRAQEYFTAWHLVSSAEVIDWRSRLEHQRWQETLVNVAQMGSAGAVVDALIAAMGSDRNLELAGDVAPDETSGEKASPKPTLLEQAKQAESVELGSRVLLNMPPSQDRERLSRALSETIGATIRDGNPVSQSMAISAIQRTPEVASFATLSPALVADTRWVRRQAQVVAPLLSRRRSSEILAEDIMFSYGRGDFLSNLPGYLKVASKTRSWRPAVLCLVTLLVLLAQMALTTVSVPIATHFIGEHRAEELAIAEAELGNLDEFREMLSILKDRGDLDPERLEGLVRDEHAIDRAERRDLLAEIAFWVSIGIAALGLAAAIALGQQLHWLAFGANVIVSLYLFLAVDVIWTDSANGTSLFLLIVAVFATGFIGLVVSMLVFGALLLLAPLSAAPLSLAALVLSRSGRVAKLPLSTIREGVGFREVREILGDIWEEFGFVVIVFLLVIGANVLYKVFFDDGSGDPTWIEQLLDLLQSFYVLLLDYRIRIFGWLPEFVELAITLGLLAVPIVFLLAFMLAGARLSAVQRLNRAAKVIMIAGSVALFFATFGTLIWLLSEALGWLDELFGEGWTVYIVFVFFALLVLGAVVLAGLLLKEILDKLLPQLRQVVYKINEAPVDPVVWKKEFCESGPRDQSALCAKVSPSRFRLTAAETLAVLEDVREYVGPDPARSAYYATVDVVLGIMRQEA